MRTVSDLWPYQRTAIARAVSNAASGDGLALFLEPGDGKTVATLTALADLGSLPALVVAPAQAVKADVWGNEAASWEHLKYLIVTPLLGRPAERERRVGTLADIYVVSYENLLWLADTLDMRRYRAIVWDELSKMKAPGTRRFRRMRGFSSSGRAMQIPVRFGLTGTPVGNHLLDLWGEMFMVAGPEPLGPTFGEYRSQYFAPIDYYERVWRLKCCAYCAKPGSCRGSWSTRCPCHARAIADIKRRIAPFVFSRPRDAPSKNPPVHIRPVTVPMPGALARVSNELMHQLWSEVDGVELEALGRSALGMKLRQLAGGACYTGDGDEWVPVHDAKLRALEDLLDELQGEPVLVYYWFQHERERIAALLGGRRWAHAGDAGALDSWNDGELEVLLAHPQSTGFSLNLQEGGHHVAWFALPWSGELWRQGNARVARQGQRADRVTAHQLLCGPADERIAAVLVGKVDTEKAVMSA